MIHRLSSGKGFTIAVGSGWARQGQVTIDIRRETSPNIVADARYLPIKSRTANQVLFTDVIEHLPQDTEVAALKEICRILLPGGHVLISTPNDVALFKLLDPERYIRGHRHYSETQILSFIQESGLTPEKPFASGFVFVMLKVLWYCIVTFPFGRLLGTTLPEAPNFLLRHETKEYGLSSSRGYTIFSRATKETD